MTTTTTSSIGAAADAFLADLAGRGREPLLKRASGTIRIDLTGGDRVEHRTVTIDRGEVTVSRRKGKADVTIALRPETLDGMVTGRVNAVAAVLRGELVAEGDLGLLMLFQRTFPSPPRRGAGTASEGAPS